MNITTRNGIVFFVIVIAIVGLGYGIFQIQQSQPQTPIAQQSQIKTLPSPATPTPQAEIITTPPPAPTPPPQPQPSLFVITYTNSGYQPSNGIIKKGDTVVFKNQSTQGMWTASAMHPTHKEYPTTGGCIGSTFDACASILPGAEWSFTFNIPGTWRYHNHLNPSHYGSITVE